jgi:dienelactone hydrolase
MLGFLAQRYRKVFVVFVFLIIAAVIFRLLLPDIIIAYRSAYIVSRVVPAVPKWFERGSYEVLMQKERDDIDIYMPKGADKTSFVIFFPGFNPDGARDPRIVNLARAFAGAGIGVAVPDSENIRQQKFSREDIDLIKNTFYFLKEQPYVASERIGLSGFSIAGSYSLRAAAEMGGNPLFVHALGAYYDLAELLEEVREEKVVYQGLERSWKPSDLSKEIAAKEANLRLSEDGATRLSPAPVLKNMQTRVYLMHDKNDDRIAVEHSRKIRDALPKDIMVSYNEFSLFQHVTPRNLLSWDVVRLSGQIFSIMRLLL